jgi:lysophospholipase L1-like esterase
MRRGAWMLQAARLAGLVLAAALAAPSSAAAAGPGCGVPEELTQVEAKLPGLRARVAAGGPLTIVAIGDASTAGIKAGTADLAYPRWVQEALDRAWPGRPVTVLNKGVPHQATDEMLARFGRDVLAAHPALVIWETGIVDAVQGVEADDFAAALRRGIDIVHRHGIDIVLMDMQFSRKATTLIDFDVYLDTMHRVGDVNGIYVFPRYAMMRYWSEEHMFDLDAVSKKEEASVAAAVYRCIGDRLAAAIVEATR